MKKKKTCDNKTQNSYDIKTNQTHLKKKKKNQTPILLKKSFGEKHCGKKQKKQRKPLFKEHLSLEKKKLTFERKLYFFNKIELLKKTLQFNRKTYLLKPFERNSHFKKKPFLSN